MRAGRPALCEGHGLRGERLPMYGTDAGLYGWGEAGGMGRERACEATIHELEHYLIGQDPGQIELF